METENQINESLNRERSLKTPVKLREIYAEAKRQESEGRLDDFMWDVYSTPPQKSFDERVEMSSDEHNIQMLHESESADLRAIRENRLKALAEQKLFEKRKADQERQEYIQKERSGMSPEEEMSINNQIEEAIK